MTDLAALIAALPEYEYPATREVLNDDGSRSIWGYGNEGRILDKLYAAIAELLAKLGERDGRQCDGCSDWNPYPVQEASGPRTGTCPIVGTETPADFGCNCWSARAAAPEPEEG
jgi:hypothetical protein